MMRTAVLLAGVFCTASGHNSAKCAINGARAVDDLLDSAIYIWAATKRCDKKLPNTEQDPIRCSLNIAASVESVNAMINVILKAVQDCGALHDEHAKCGMAAGQLTRAFAGLAAASSGVIAKCPNSLNNNKPLITYSGASGSLANGGMSSTSHIKSATDVVSASMGQCIINVKDTMKSLFKAMKRLMYIKDDCDADHHGAHHCAHHALKVVAGLAAVGEYLAGAIGKCTSNAKLAVNAQCAQESLELVQYLHDVGRAGVELSKHCEEGAKRLYELEHMDSEEGSFSLPLAAFLPIAGVLGFAVGTRFYKRQTEVQSFTPMEPMAEQSLE